MNLTDPEHIAAVRQALAAGLTECWLVVEGEYLDMAEMFDADGQMRESPQPPADWVALTGACERCPEGAGCDIDMCQDCGDEYSYPCERHADHPHLTDDDGCCPHCIDGRKRATLTVAAKPIAHKGDLIPLVARLVVATVEVLPNDGRTFKIHLTHLEPA